MSGCGDTEAGMVARDSDVFVGRVDELAELERVLATASDGRGATVLIAGEAGIGKTSLAAELGRRAFDAGFEILLGRSIELIGTELPYQPVLEALRPLGDPRCSAGDRVGSQLQLFEAALALLNERTASAPVLLVLEDLHWADNSTLDLVAFLAHNVDDRRILLLGTYRADEPASADRVRRLAAGVGRTAIPLVVELGPLGADAMTALLAAHGDAALTQTLTDVILTRAQGNPFFAEQLAAAAGDLGGALPTGLRDVLLRRVARLDRQTQCVLRLAAAAGRDVPYSLVKATAQLAEPAVREALRRAVEHGVLVPDQAGGSFRFRHALLAEAIYTTILPGEREELHGRLAEELARSGAAAPAELAPHWAAAGRTAAALATSVDAARQAQAVFGLVEALAHLERALSLWPDVPGADELVGLDLADLCAWAAELASQTGAAPRAVELTRRALELVDDSDASRAAPLHQHLGRYLFESGSGDSFLSELERAVEIVPTQPPSVERASALAALGTGLHIVWRFDESQAICEQALELAGALGASDVEIRARTTLGCDLAYLGRTADGLAQLDRALDAAHRIADPVAVQRAYISLTDVLTMLGRPRASAEVAEKGIAALRPYGVDLTVLAANWIEALLFIGEWERADDASAAALRSMTANYPHMPLGLRAAIELGRGRFDAARAGLAAARPTVRHQPGLATLCGWVAELAVWERRWTDADEAVRDGMARARPRWGAQMRVWLSATGLRASAELALLARTRRDPDSVRRWLGRARSLRRAARRAAADASAITPNADGWLALAEAEYGRLRPVPSPDLWAAAAATWDRLERPPLAAYCRWRQAESLVAGGSSRTAAGEPLRRAHAVAVRVGAAPLLVEIELLAERARLDLAEPFVVPPAAEQGVGAVLGLTTREVEVLGLVARGYTNREIAATLVISPKTASVHVSHILHKLGAPNRVEAAAIAHRLAPPGGTAPDGAPGAVLS
jgi:DNA-binding CsgD family transcriptional regulator/tetratricopeptide (TPR) repeat protein